MILDARKILPWRPNPRILFYNPIQSASQSFSGSFYEEAYQRLFLLKLFYFYRHNKDFFAYGWKKEAFQNVYQRIAVYKTSILGFFGG